jgi:hypothetical protein
MRQGSLVEKNDCLSPIIFLEKNCLLMAVISLVVCLQVFPQRGFPKIIKLANAHARGCTAKHCY